MRIMFRLIFLAAFGLTPGVSNAEETLPNFVIIYIDDMGYADIGPFGAEDYATPHLDRMAAEGMRLTDFQVSSAVCSASRAALLTGCYHVRVGFHGALGPSSNQGIHDREVTIAELLKEKGYATACFGKWHLGHHRQFLPLQHGFDEYYGLPYSNDMWPYHPSYADVPPAAAKRKQGYPDLPLIKGNEIIDPIVTGEDQARLTTAYTERAVDFIQRNAKRPFFLYVPHSMVHVPLFVSEKFAGKSGAGLFGDVVMEIDWSVGQIRKALEEAGIDDRTLVVFTSDNGPWLNYGDHAGSAKPLREGKGTMFEGGCRVPTIACWPGKVPAGTTCDELALTMDLLPTIAALTGASLPDHQIDGKDIRPLLMGEEGARSPHDSFAHYYHRGSLQAIRDREWKLHFPHRYRTLKGRPGGSGGKPVNYDHAEIGEALFHLKTDVGETTDVAKDHPEVVNRLRKLAEAVRADLGDKLTERVGEGIRPAAQLPTAPSPPK